MAHTTKTTKKKFKYIIKIKRLKITQGWKLFAIQVWIPLNELLWVWQIIYLNNLRFWGVIFE